MSALSFAKHAASAFGRDKPHSSVTDLVEILTAGGYEEESLEGVPELVEAINLQPTGPAEASRAIRKKLKHGDVHRQYRAIVLLKAVVENGGHKFQTTFCDDQLTDAIKQIVSDPSTDTRVRKKLISVLLSWHREFQGDARMSVVANLYRSVPSTRARTIPQEVDNAMLAQKQEAKLKAKQEKEEEKRRKEEEARKKAERAKRRQPFDFEKEKPQILNSIAETSQAASNLVNALKLVNPENDNVQTNPRVQECLEKAKQARKRVVRYIQLVENEDLIGTLLETNERIIDALQQYDVMLLPDASNQDEVEDINNRLNAVKVHHSGASEVGRLQEKQRAAVERSVNRSKGDDSSSLSPPQSAGVHPDLHDLEFSELGDRHNNLPPPIRPTAKGSDDEDDTYARGSLSDYSDYESSDEERHNRRIQAQHSEPSTSYGHQSARRNYVSVSQDSLDESRDPRRGLLVDVEDPFADPFADQDEPETPSIASRAESPWQRR